MLNGQSQPMLLHSSQACPITFLLDIMPPGYNGRYQAAPLHKFSLTRVRVWMRNILICRALLIANLSTKAPGNRRACCKFDNVPVPIQTHRQRFLETTRHFWSNRVTRSDERYVFYCKVDRISPRRNRLGVDREKLARFPGL